MEIQNREGSSWEEPVDKTYFTLCHLELILKKNDVELVSTSRFHTCSIFLLIYISLLP